MTEVAATWRSSERAQRTSLALFLVACLALGGHLGGMEDSARRATALACVVGAGFLRPGAWTWGAGAVALLLAVLMALAEGPLAPSLALCGLAVPLSLPRPTRVMGVSLTLLALGWSASIFGSFWEAGPGRGLGAWTDLPSEYGADARGDQVFVFGLLGVIALGSGRLQRGVGGVLLVLVFGAQAWLGRGVAAYASPYWEHGHPADPFDHQLPLGLGVCMIVAWCATSSRAPLPSSARPRWHIAFGALGMLAACGAVGWGGTRTLDQPVVGFLNHGGLDWELPTTAQRGPMGSGMFGALPLYLEQAGWTCRALEEADLTQLDAAGVDVVVTINAPHIWSEAERAAVRRFVSAGGGLLMLADHTNVYGAQVGGNSLLGEHGMQLAFDSAVHSGADWIGDLDFGWGAPQPMRSASRAGISIGASLDLAPPAMAYIIGRRAFSDLGIAENLQGAFLGNYEIDPGEPVGGVAVAGVRYLGRGMLLALGDTSGFQNAALPASFRTFVEPLFAWLATPSHVPRLPLVWAGWGALLVAALAGLGLGERCRTLLPAFLAGALFAGMLLPATPLPVGPSSGVPKVLLDTGHAPRITDLGVNWNDPWPVALAALRTGALPHYEAQAVAELGPDVALLVVIAPQVPFTAEEGAQIEAWLQQGGCLMVLASGRDARAVNELLNGFGLRIGAESLGPIPKAAGLQPGGPRFVDAAIVASVDQATTLVDVGGRPLVVRVGVGRGSVVVVGDTRFASTSNTEGVDGEWAPNIALLNHILCRYAGGRLDGFEEVFEAPVELDAYGRAVVEGS